MLNLAAAFIMLGGAAYASRVDPSMPAAKQVAAGETARKMASAIADMHLPSEALVINPQFSWQYRPQVTMHAPRGDAIASWWKGNRPVWTHAIVPWFTAFEARGNRARNSRVQIRNLRLFILSNRTRKWLQVDHRLRPYVALWKYPFVAAGPACGRVAQLERDGGLSLVPDYPFFIHGWGDARSIDASDVGATFIAMDFRLIIDDPRRKDDRNVARYVVDVGADYYPDQTLRWSLDYAPGVGNGRMLLARRQWRTATLVVPNKDHGITYEKLHQNPPPLVAPEMKVPENTSRGALRAAIHGPCRHVP
jgi:hypothetical protein